MEKFSPAITTEDIKKTAKAACDAFKSGAVAGAVSETAKLNTKKVGKLVSDKALSAVDSVKDTKVVSDLISDIENKPEKVKREVGIAAAAAAVTFAGIRLYGSYGKSEKSESDYEIYDD